MKSINQRLSEGMTRRYARSAREALESFPRNTAVDIKDVRRPQVGRLEVVSLKEAVLVQFANEFPYDELRHRLIFGDDDGLRYSGVRHWTVPRMDFSVTEILGTQAITNDNFAFRALSSSIPHLRVLAGEGWAETAIALDPQVQTDMSAELTYR